MNFCWSCRMLLLLNEWMDCCFWTTFQDEITFLLQSNVFQILFSSVYREREWWSQLCAKITFVANKVLHLPIVHNSVSIKETGCILLRYFWRNRFNISHWELKNATLSGTVGKPTNGFYNMLKAKYKQNEVRKSWMNSILKSIDIFPY